MRRVMSRVLLFISMCVTLGLPAAAWEREALTAFHERRVRLVRETGGDGIVILFGYREQDIGVATTPFRQNENFYYMTGWSEPDAMLMLVPKARPGEPIKALLYTAGVAPGTRFMRT